MAEKEYTVVAPDGKEITLIGPVGASQDEIIAQAQRLYKEPKAAPAAPVEQAYAPKPVENPVWESTGGGAAMGRPRQVDRTNVLAEPRPLESALAGVTKGAVINPVLGVTQLATGGRVGGPTAERYAQEAQVYKNAAPEAFMGGEIAGSILPAARVGGAIGQIPSFARAMPAATQAVASVAPKLAPLVAPIAQSAGYGAVSSAMTPDESGVTGNELLANRLRNMATDTAISGAIPLATPVIKEAGKYSGKALAELLGQTTGVGGTSVGQAARSGVERNPQFIENLRGDVSAKDVLEAAQGGMQTLAQKRNEAYQKGFATTKANQVFLDFAPIEDKFKGVVDSLNVKGVGGVQASKVGPDTMKDVNQIQAILGEWKSKPELHTAEGLDALKRRVDDLYRNDMTNEAKSVLTQTRGAIKNTIVAQDKNYAKTMRDYEKAREVEKDIEDALGTGKRKSVDSAIRKLQSVTRNNANTSYAYRQELADMLKKEAGVDLMPALAGQSMSAVFPRGIQKFVPTLTAGAGAANPALWATLPLQSPRLVGEAAYGAGRAVAPLVDLANSVKLTDEQRKLIRLLEIQAAQKATQGVINE
jgi:hypothetical protein